MRRQINLSALAIVALAGSSAGAQAIEWGIPVDGNWNLASNWFSGNVPNIAAEDAVLGNTIAYTVDMTNSFTIGALSLTNPAASLELGSSLTFTLEGHLLNDGFIFVNEPGSIFDVHLRFNSDAMITGAGSIRLGAISNPGDAQLISNTGFTVTNTSGHTIHGSGLIAGDILNNGFIIADDAIGSGLRIAGTLTQGAGGSAGANTGSLLLGNGSVVTGGLMSTINGGEIRVENGVATIGDITSSGLINIPGQAYTLAMNGGVVNDGVISINSNSSVFDARLRFDVTSALSGAGTVNMFAGTSNDAQLLTGGAVVGTIGAGQLVQGSGQINGASGGTIENLGTINANDATALSLFGNHIGNGMYRSDNGLLDLGNGLVLDGGTFDSTGTGIAELTSSGTAILANVTNLGQMGIRGSGGSIHLAGPMTNDGTITVNSNDTVFNAHLRFVASTAINGSGDIRMVSMGDLGDAQIFTNAVFNGTISASQTVAGSGLVDGRNGGTIINNGTINGDHAIDGKIPAIALELRGNIDGSGGGVFRSDDGILALGNGLILDGGTFDSSGVGIVDATTSGIATLSNVTNLGQMGIRGQGGSISLAGPMTNNGTLTINSNNNGFNAHLRFIADTAITGSGMVRMVVPGELGDAQVFTLGAFVGTIGAGQTIAGSGLVDGRLGGTIVNNGTINGDDLVFPLELRGNHNGLGGGVYRSDDGVLALGGGLALDGGAFDSSGTGIVDMTGSGIATLSNVTNLGQMGIRGQGGGISLAGPLTNDGTLTINSNSNGFNAHLRFVADTAINGSGTVRMQILGDLGDAQLFTDGEFFGMIGANQTIAGSGLVDGRSLGTIVNDGTINGDDPAFELRLQGNHDGTGGGVYRSDDGLLGLSSGLVMNGGTFDSSGTGIVDMTTNGTVMMANMTNIGTLGIRGQGGVVGLDGPLTNNGMILINSNDNGFNAHIRFFAATEINGTGTINMELAGNFGDAQILNDQGFIGTIGSGQTITGSGNVTGIMNMNGTFDPSSDERRFDIDTTHLSATSGFVADLGGLLGGEFDRLTLGSNTINLDGTLTVNLDAGYNPVFGDSWDIISGGTVNGEFATSNMPSPPLGLVYRDVYEPSRVFVVLTCASDLNGDNVLDFFDVSVFLSFFSNQDVRADINGDGFFDFFDVSLFLQIFSGTCE